MTATESNRVYRLSDRFTRDSGTVFLTGIQAMARLPLEQLRADRAAGLNTAAFAAGYPGSPLGGLDAALERAVKESGETAVVLRPSVNEEYAATAVMGSQLAGSRPDARYDGVIGIWYGKAPGVDRASDAIRHAMFAGADPKGGVVLLAGDDPSAKSSTLPSTSAGVLADLHIPVLYPGDPTDVLELGHHAIAMSRATGLWVGMKIVSNVADGSANVRLDPARVDPVIPLHEGRPYQHRPDPRLLTPYTLDIEREIVEVRTNLALKYAELNHLNRVVVDSPDAWIGIISSGITYWEVREALAVIGLDSDDKISSAGIRMLRMGLPIPFNASTIRDFAAGLEEIFVIEEKTPNVESRAKDALYNTSHRPRIVGEFDEFDRRLIKSHGALHADDLVGPLRSRLARLSDRLTPEPPVRERIPLAVNRTPYFCSGCPHNRSTVTDPGTAVGAGIGCHTMILLGGESRYGDVAGLTCMGSEGAQWIGMAPFVETPHLIQNMGDGTFFHSGQLAMTAAIAAGVNITYKLLWNGAVAMTGGQDPTGGIPLDRVCQSLLAQGVVRIIIASDDPVRTRRLGLPSEVAVRDRTELAEAQQELAAVSGVTVLIYDQRCAAELRRDRKRGKISQPRTRVAINHRVCEGCGHCAEISNCLSVQPFDTPFGRKTTIDQDSCNVDLSCLEGDCPAFVTITRPKRPRRRRASASAELPAPPTPIPAPPVSTGADVNIHITGIGGTGVVTTGQLIGTAAMLDGSNVQGLDQIGLSQKAGPVVSDLRITRHSRSGSNRLGRSPSRPTAGLRPAGGGVSHRTRRGRRGPHRCSGIARRGAPGLQDRPPRDTHAHRRRAAGAGAGRNQARRSVLGQRIRPGPSAGGRCGGGQRVRGGHGCADRTIAGDARGSGNRHRAQRSGRGAEYRRFPLGPLVGGRPGDGGSRRLAARRARARRRPDAGARPRRGAGPEVEQPHRGAGRRRHRFGRRPGAVHRRVGEVPESGSGGPLSGRGVRVLRRRAAGEPRLCRADRDSGRRPVQAHRLQGRVRGGPPNAGFRRPRPRGSRRSARRPAGLATAPTHPAGHGPQDQDRPVD